MIDRALDHTSHLKGDKGQLAGAWKTRLGPANAIFEYLEIYCNRWPRHSGLGMLTPVALAIMPARSNAPGDRDAGSVVARNRAGCFTPVRCLRAGRTGAP
jgi:hypothetical protein